MFFLYFIVRDKVISFSILLVKSINPYYIGDYWCNKIYSFIPLKVYLDYQKYNSIFDCSISADHILFYNIILLFYIFWYNFFYKFIIILYISFHMQIICSQTKWVIIFFSLYLYFSFSLPFSNTYFSIFPSFLFFLHIFLTNLSTMNLCKVWSLDVSCRVLL